MDCGAFCPDEGRIDRQRKGFVFLLYRLGIIGRGLQYPDRQAFFPDPNRSVGRRGYNPTLCRGGLWLLVVGKGPIQNVITSMNVGRVSFVDLQHSLRHCSKLATNPTGTSRQHPRSIPRQRQCRDRRVVCQVLAQAFAGGKLPDLDLAIRVPRYQDFAIVRQRHAQDRCISVTHDVVFLIRIVSGVQILVRTLWIPNLDHGIRRTRDQSPGKEQGRFTDGRLAELDLRQGVPGNLH
mmetsp:Transcript_2200/g.5869  ORF Transcript_2200/g.5869 Transcript_2200/m.5869 type:complete len:236 (+) Transcript_2200:1928-2635(+)